MTKQVFSKVMTYICVAFDKEPSKELFEAYWSVLKDKFNDEEFKEVGKKILQTKKFFPKIAEFLETAKPDDDDLFLQAKEAFNTFVEAFARNGIYRSYDFEDKLINDVVNELGGLMAFNVDLEKLRWMEKDFIKLYVTKIKKQAPIKNIVVGGIADESELVKIECGYKRTELPAIEKKEDGEGKELGGQKKVLEIASMAVKRI